MYLINVHERFNKKVGRSLRERRVNLSLVPLQISEQVRMHQFFLEESFCLFACMCFETIVPKKEYMEKENIVSVLVFFLLRNNVSHKY